MNPGHSASLSGTGAALLEQGCRQGALLDAAARMLWLRASTGAKEKDESWSIAEGTIQDALLVVVSQDCDIFAPSKTEPCVEAITARWSSNRSEIHSARKGNSARLYLLKEEEGGRALIADARGSTSTKRRSAAPSLQLFSGATTHALVSPPGSRADTTAPQSPTK